LEVPLGDRRPGAAARDATATRDAATGVYYDRLWRWTGWLTPLGYGGGRRTLTAHRALADPRMGGRTTFTRLHDVLAAALPAPLHGRVLDAGCGLGGTMLDLAARGSATFVGLTLSEQQAVVARRAVADAGRSARIEVRVESYDSPPPGPFDGVVAIESLAHSPQPTATIATLAAQLTPGGWLAIVDDMPRAAAHGTNDLAAFKAGWRLPVLLSATELQSALEHGGLTLATEQDLTGEVRPRTLRRIAQLERVNRALQRVAWSPGLRAMLESYRGGLALERLYRHGLMDYRLVVARRRR
jgi:SAM-dependent methyltransferase